MVFYNQFLFYVYLYSIYSIFGSIFYMLLMYDHRQADKHNINSQFIFIVQDLECI